MEKQKFGLQRSKGEEEKLENEGWMKSFGLLRIKWYLMTFSSLSCCFTA